MLAVDDVLPSLVTGHCIQQTLFRQQADFHRTEGFHSIYMRSPKVHGKEPKGLKQFLSVFGCLVKLLRVVSSFILNFMLH